MEEKNQEVNEVITKDEKINAQQTNEEVAGTSTPEKKSDVPPLLKQTKKNVKTKPVIDSLAQSAIKAFKEKLDLKDGNIADDILKKLNISENADGKLEIPYFDEKGQIVDTKQFTDENNFKWKKGISPNIYGLNLLKDYNKNQLVITADDSTCIALLANNIKAIAICGDTVPVEVATEVEMFSKVYVLIDDTEKTKNFYNVIFDNIRLKNAYVIYSNLYGYENFLEMNRQSKAELNAVLGNITYPILNIDGKKTDHDVIGEQLLYNLKIKYSNGHLYYYDGSIYQPATSDFLNSHITKNICRNASKGKKSNTREYIQDKLFNTNIKKPDCNYVAFKNCLYNLKNDKPIPFTPDIFVINKLNINYLADLPDSNLEVDTYVDEIMFHNDKRKKAYFQTTGYCLTSKNDLQVIIFYFGPTASNGKSSATDILSMMVNRENICHIALDEFSEKFAKTGVADKLLDITTEVTNKKILDTAVLKQAVTGDIFEGNIKHVQKRPIIQPYLKIVVCANEFPQTNDHTDGYFRRFIILLFENKFDPKTSKFNIDDFCTQKNLDYLGNKSFRTYLDSCKEPEFIFANAEESNAILAQYKDANDTVKGYLNDEDSIVNAPEFDIYKTEVLADYREYCKDNKQIALSKKQFYKEILEKSDIEEHRIDGYLKFKRKAKKDTSDKK